MSNPDDLRGIIPPVLTPLLPDGSVDADSLARHVDFLLAAGVHGLFLLGSSGEAPYLDDSQRRYVIETAAGAAAGRVPIAVGVIDTATPRVIQQARLAHAAGADFIVATSPFFAQSSPEEIEIHLRQVRRETELPLIAYSVPSRTGTALSRSTVRRLHADRVIVGIKDSSPDFGAFRRLLAESADPSSLRAFIGSEVLVDVALFVGAVGAVPGLANVAPAEYVSIYDAAAKGDWDTARDIQNRLARLFAIIDVGRDHGLGLDAAAYAAFKTALVHRGVIDHPTTAAPQQPLPPAAVAEIHDIVDREGLR